MFSFRRRITSGPDVDVDVDVLAPADIVGQGLVLKGHVLSLVADSQPAAHSFRVIAQQGKGSYAVVYQAQEIIPLHPERARKFAIKCLSKRNLDEEARALQMAEVTIHQSLRLHLNIVTLYRTLQTPDYLLLVLEFVEGEDLFYFLEQSRDDDNDNESLSFSSTPPTPSLLSTSQPSRLLSYTRLRLIASMFAQMCDAVAACHDQNVFHRDIKPENFIVTDEPLGADRRVRVKLTDFGLSTREVECSDMDCGSAPYMSYECRNNIAPTYKPRAADVWSLGIVLINMLYHINPWTDTAHGACPSFETFCSTPTHSKFQFFMDRFPGMTKPVAEMLANRVFCILEDASDDSMRIEARELGKWVRGLPELLASGAVSPAAITTTTALASSAGSPTIAGMVPLSLVLQQRHHQQHHHRRTTSTSTSPSGCPSPALSPSALPPVIQGHRLSLSMRISHRPTSRSRPASVYSSASNRNSLLIGSPALGGRLPLPMPIPLSRAPSLEPALEREEFGLGLSPSKERLVDEDGSPTLTTTAYSNASNGTVVVPAAGVGEGEEPEGDRDGLEVDAGSGRESVMNPPSTRWRKRGARGKGAQAHAQAQAAQGSQTPLQGQMMNSQGTQTPPLVGTMTGPVPPPLPSSPSSPPTGTATTTDPLQPQDTTHHTLAAASQSLASSVSKSGTGAVAATAAGSGVGVPGSVNPGPAFVPSHAVGFVSDSVLGVGSINGDLNEDVNQGPEDVGADSNAQRATSSPSIKASPLSVFASKFGGGEKERTASHAPLGTAAPVTSATTPTSSSKLTTKSSMSSTKGASSIKNASTLSLPSSQRYEPVTGPVYAVPSAVLSKPTLPGGVPVLNPNLNGGESESNKIDVVAASKNETASKNAQVPVPVTKKPSKWKLSLRKSGAAAAAAAAATIEEAKVVPPPSATASETGSGASMTASAGGASANGPMTTAMLASLAPPPAGSLLRSSSSTSLTPTTPGGAGSVSSNHQNQNAMSTTASNVTNLIMGLNPPHHHQQQHPGGGGGGGGVDHMSNHSNRSTPSVGSDSSRQGKWRRRRRSRERDGGAAIGFGTCAMGSFGVGTGTANSSTVSSVRTFGAGGQRSAGSGPLYTSPNLYVSSSLSGSALGLLPGSPTDAIATAAPRHLQQQQQQPQVYHQNPALYHLQQERERVITPTSLRGGGGAFTFGHNNGRHHTSFVPSTSTALPFSSSSSTSWRNSMTSTSTSTSMFSNSGTSSSTSAAASMSSPGGSTSAFTRYSNSSTRSVSTTATSVSDISWRGGVKGVNNVGGANGNGTGTGVNPPSGNSNANVSSYPNIPKNVKMIPGVPWEVDQLPRGQHMNPVGDIFGSPPTRKQRTRNKKAKQDSASGNLNGGGGGGGGGSSSATAGGSLDTINEKPMSGESGTGGGSVSVSVGVGSVATWKDASTSTSDLIAREEDAAATTTTTTTTTNSGTVKKVHKGQINALAKMLSALRR